MGVAKLREGSFGTRVACPACRHSNLAIDIWCERCGSPMESAPARMAATTALPEPPPAPDPPVLPKLVIPEKPRRPAPEIPTFSMPRISWPRLSVPGITWPRLSVLAIAGPRLPLAALPKLRAPRVSRLVLVVAAVLAVLLIAPLAYVLLPAIRPALGQTGELLPATNAATPAPNSALAAAIGGVKAKTGLPYAAARCATSGPCLTVAREISGEDGAAVVFSTAGTAGRQCVGYVFRASGSWHFLDSVCGLPGQLSPLVGRDATVHVPGNCANLRDQASLNGTVIACLNDATTVHIDAGPNYADGRLWWHGTNGWIAHDFLTGP